MMWHNSPDVAYKVLVCDDKQDYIDKLCVEISKLNSRYADFFIDVTATTSSYRFRSLVNNNNYDLIVLDACFEERPQNETANDTMRLDTNTYCYGPELYLYVHDKSPEAPFFFVSHLSRLEMIDKFKGAEGGYFSKEDTTTQELAKEIREFFLPQKRTDNNVFVVYGHNKQMKEGVTTYIKSLGINPLFLDTDGLRSVFDALEKIENNVDAAVVLFSADDLIINHDLAEMQLQPRPNVLIELGLFAGKLGRDRVVILYEKHQKFVFPSDVAGVFYIPYSKEDSWKQKLKEWFIKKGF